MPCPLLCCLSVASSRSVRSWPAARGPTTGPPGTGRRRDGICRETGLLKDWPKEGPQAGLGGQGNRRGLQRTRRRRQCALHHGQLRPPAREGPGIRLGAGCRKAGRQLWASPIGPIRHKGGGFPGPRSTPRSTASASIRWASTATWSAWTSTTDTSSGSKNLVADFGGGPPNWGYSESVLIDGERLLCTPGGAKATIVAVYKRAASRCGRRPSATRPPIRRSSPSPPERETIRDADGQGRGGGAGRRRQVPSALQRPVQPRGQHRHLRQLRPDGLRRLRLRHGRRAGLGPKTADGFNAKEMYFTKKMQNHHGGMILWDGALYGCSNPNMLTCLDYKSGEVKWTDRSSGKCSLLWADGMLYCRSEKGPISLVEATPAGFKLHGRFNQPDRGAQNSWPHLVIADGVMYVRDQDVLLAYDVAE